MPLRRVGFTLVIVLALADVVGAAYLWLLWHDRQGQHAPPGRADAPARH